MDFKDLSGITGGTIPQLINDCQILDLVTDSRKVPVMNLNALFFAIKGPHHNGHDFIVDLYNQGFRNFVIEQAIDLDQLPEANVLRVENTIHALQNICAHKRGQFRIPVLAITGSNAKTIIKEWLYQLLSIEYRTLRSPKSFNSQLGVPLSVWQLNPVHEFAIFEAGISTIGEMSNLQKVILPTLGIFTNIGTAHEEGFSSIKEKIQEKLQLFSGCELVIYCQDHKEIDREITSSEVLEGQLLTWSFEHDSDIQIESILPELFRFNYKGQSFDLNIPFSDLASRENVLHCIALMLFLEFDIAKIQEGINSLESIKMRLEMKKGINNCYIIDDTYNNDLAGLEIALQFLQFQNQRTSKTVILSDIPQSLMFPETLYSKVNDLLLGSGIDKIIGIGSNLFSVQNKIQVPGEYYKSTDAFLANFNEEYFQNEAILVKGARDFTFERIVSKLAEKLHETVLEIDLDALTHNLNFYRGHLERDTKIMVMVKALAYGSGSTEISNLLQFHKVDYLAVAYTDEGIEIRKNGVDLPIMVMNPRDDLKQLLQYDLEPEVFSLDQLQHYAIELEHLDEHLAIHFNINTGMNRLGFEIDQIDAALSIITASKRIKVRSVFTHLAGSDAIEHKDFTLDQLERFKNEVNSFEAQLGYPVIKHALNSAGILNFPEFQMDMVRLGIGLHGFDPSEKSDALVSVSALKTVVSQVRHLGPGDTIGYSRKGVATNTMSIATIAIGYADGYSRAFSDGVGEVIVNGKRCKVIGNVCMDMTMIDVTNVDVKAGDTVTIFSRELPIQEVSEYIDTIPYEILTSVSARVKRVYFTS